MLIPKPSSIAACLFAALASPLFAEQMPREDVVDVPAMAEGLNFHNLFQSNMVLQRDKPIGLWGWGTPGETVTVSLAGNSQTTKVGEDRSWKVSFPAMPASSDPAEITAKDPETTVKLENILIGDIWVLGGQSNMEFPLSKVERGDLDIASANYDGIRILTIPSVGTPEPRKDFQRLHEWSDWSSRHFRKGDWDVCSPEIVKELSAIGYVFGRRIHQITGVPIGLVDVSVGGTTVETWTPESVVRKIDTEPAKNLIATWDQKIAEWDGAADLENQIKKHEQRVEKLKKEGKPIPANLKAPTEQRPGPAFDKNRPGNCYAGMIAPLHGFAVKGALWHQGYNNCFSGTEGAMMYRDVFPQMITSWRAAFGDPEMPFGILSLCTAGDKQNLDNYSSLMADTGAFIREAQYQTFLEMFEAGDENIGFTSTYDLRRRWYHPQLKYPAGERIARWALATEYGMEKEFRWKPAFVEEMKVVDGSIQLKMDGPVGAVDDGGPIEGFAIAGEDRKFHPATADFLVTGKDNRGRDQKDSTVLVLTSPMVPEPVAYRYAWARNPMGNLQVQRGSDIPFATQRSDDWPKEAIFIDGELKEMDGRPLQNALRELDKERALAKAKALLEEHEAK